MEAAIYTEVFKARPDATDAMHSHSPMCVALSMADKTVVNMHRQSKQFGEGVPMYPDPIFIIDPQEGVDLAKTLGNASAVIIWRSFAYPLPMCCVFLNRSSITGARFTSAAVTARCR
jgi:ribulose-5-phosphate 4-epimerase/fuculose-1-phosphate aldolase